MRRAKRIPLKIKPRYAVVVDGETEFWYIQMLKRNERFVLVDLKPEIPQLKKLAEQYDMVVGLSKDYDKVYWIIDFDVINKETQEAKKGKETALQEFRKYYDNVANNYDNIVIVIINNPCFEYWLLLHFESTSKFYASYKDLVKHLKKYLPDYVKSQAYYTKQNSDIYLRLFKHLPTAVSNAKKLKEFDFENPATGISQMYILLEDAGIIKNNI